MRRWRTNLGLVIASLVLPMTGWSHGVVPDGPSNLKWNVKRKVFMPRDPAAIKTSRKPDEYVIVLPNRWALGQSIRVCFYGGDPALRQRLLDVASQWFQHVNLKLDSPQQGRDCRSGDTSEVRIGFSEPGYWSYIGTDSVNPLLIQRNLASMNFAGFDFQPIEEPRFTGVVLHEFGHALGFHHEHQSPGTSCDTEYDWPKLYDWYQTSYKWSRKTVDDNVRQLLADSSAYEWSDRDPKSIMVYKSDERFLKAGKASKCNFQENHALSTVDKQGASRAYPITGLPEQERIDRLRRAIATETNPQTRAALARQLQIVENPVPSR